MTTRLQPSPNQHLNQDQILRDNIDLVYKIARYYSQLVSNHYDDLVQVGSIGLFNAIKRYDPSHNANFRTYASHLITSEIKHYLRDHISLVKAPRELQELMPKIRQSEQRWRQSKGREPTPEEISTEIGVALEKIKDAYGLEYTLNHLSLDQEISQTTETGSSWLEQLEDKKYRSFQLVQEDKILVGDAISELKTQSQQIIDFVFYQDLTQTEIAKHLGISQMQVSRRLKRALNELWTTLNTKVTPW